MIPTEPEDTRSGHVPDDLVYGPVHSRRFGLSLGVSFSAPGATVCRWRCPYCQLGDWPYDETRPWPQPEEIVAQTARALKACHERPLVVTVAGGGEPSDHPDFAALSTALRELADAHGVRLILLTNGDGCTDAGKRAAFAHYHHFQVKWDPGPRAGSWRPGAIDRQARFEALAGLPGLRLQTMLFDDDRGGNHKPEDLARFCADLQTLRPEAVHLGTIDRNPRLSRYRPVDGDGLHCFAEAVTATTGVPVFVH